MEPKWVQLERSILDRAFLRFCLNFLLWRIGNGEIENFEDKIAKKLNKYLHKICNLDNMCTFDWDNFLKSCPLRFFVKKV